MSFRNKNTEIQKKTKKQKCTKKQLTKWIAFGNFNRNLKDQV